MRNLIEEFEDIAKHIIAGRFSSYDEILKSLYRKDYMIPRLFKIIDEMPQTIYRARPASEFDFWDKKQYSYPPAELCKTMGRANFIGEPVFYGAISAETAVRELMFQDRRITNEDKVFISEWKITCPMKFYIALLLYPEDTFKGTLYEQFEHLSTTQFDDLVKEEKDFDHKLYKALYRKIGGHFIDSSPESYSLTAFIANNLFYGTEDYKMNAPIIAYPSVSGMFNGVNYAIERNFAKKYLELTGIRYGTFGGFKDGGFVMHASKFSEVKNGSIEWFDFITRIFYDKFGIEYDFDGDYPEDLDPEVAILMKDEQEFDIHSFVKELVSREDSQLIRHFPNSFPYNEIPFEQQRKAVGLTLPRRSIYVISYGEKLFLNNMNLHLDYRHEKGIIKEKSGFMLSD